MASEKRKAGLGTKTIFVLLLAALVLTGYALSSGACRACKIYGQKSSAVHIAMNGIKLSVPKNYANFVEIEDHSSSSPCDDKRCYTPVRDFGFQVEFPGFKETTWLPSGKKTKDLIAVDFSTKEKIYDIQTVVARSEKAGFRVEPSHLYENIGLEGFVVYKESGDSRVGAIAKTFIYAGSMAGKPPSLIMCQKTFKFSTCTQSFKLDEKSAVYISADYKENIIYEWAGVQSSVTKIGLSFLK